MVLEMTLESPLDSGRSNQSILKEISAGCSLGNLNSILKSRDITLQTKVPLVKAMVCPVVMYGCESWTVKKAEH